MNEYYARQTTLIGAEAQNKLRRTKILLVGAGGVGCPAATHLVTAGVGRLTILDPDRVETTNLHRQNLYRPGDEGRPKALLAAERLRRFNPEVEILALEAALDKGNARELIADHDLVLDGTDNFGTRFLCGDVCATLGKTLVSAAVFRFQGQLATFDACIHYRDLYPHPPAPGTVPDCSQAGTVGAFVSIIGTLQAAEAIKVATQIGENLKGKLLVFDGLNYRNSILTLSPNPENPLRSGRAISDSDYDYFCGAVPEIDRKTLIEWKAQGKEHFLLDVRTPEEARQKNYGGRLIPLAELEMRIGEIPRDKKIVVHCQTGKRSRQATALLMGKYGFKDVVSLSGTPPEN